MAVFQRFSGWAGSVDFDGEVLVLCDCLFLMVEVLIKLIQAVLSSDHDTSIKRQLIPQICNHAQLSNSDARQLWKTFLSISIHGPSPTHRSGARIVLDHLTVSHNGGRNDEINSILQVFSDSGIDIQTASELLITLNSVMTQKGSDGWGITSPMSVVDWFLNLCCTHAADWPPPCRVAIARVFCKEGLMGRIGGGDGAGRLLDTALTWIVASPSIDDVLAEVIPLVVLVNAVSRGLPATHARAQSAQIDILLLFLPSPPALCLTYSVGGSAMGRAAARVARVRWRRACSRARGGSRRLPGQPHPRGHHPLPPFQSE
jgi:hypothetical protein